jgi:hypothetical protein
LSTTLSICLKKPLIWLLGAVVAVSIAILTALPAIAQETQQTPAVSTEADQNPLDGYTNPATTPSRPAASEPPVRLMVYPGDSLWSISQRHLGPQASPQQIANEVERIFELNRDRIGENPSMLMPGEELLLAPSVSEPEADMPANEPENAPAAAAAVEPAAQQPPVAASEGSEPAAQPAPSEENEPGAESPAAKNETSEPVETASDAPLDIPAIAQAYLPDERELIGLGIFVLTFLLALLMLWKLPMRRDRGTEAWGTFARASYQAAPRRAPTSEVSGEQTAISSQPQKSTSGFANKTPTNGQAERYVDLPVAMGIRRKLSRTPRGSLSRKRRARKGWATGVYSSPVRCALRRAASIQTRSVPGGASVTPPPARGRLLREAHQRRR